MTRRQHAPAPQTVGTVTVCWSGISAVLQCGECPWTHVDLDYHRAFAQGATHSRTHSQCSHPGCHEHSSAGHRGMCRKHYRQGPAHE